MKRGFNTEEARHYLGLSRGAFEANILSKIRDKGVKVGTATVYEVTDLDLAWEEFKKEKQKSAKEKQEGDQKCSVPASRAFTGRATSTKSTRSFDVSEFDVAASQVLKKRKST